jgi:ferric-dicitrate binding protein FerR (iron transport regulator)
MADGTKVWLNAGSNIKYNADYNKHDREIFLEGEAYFEVAKNPDKAFHVYADKIVVHALGTKFNVKAYAEENVVETTLIEGSVSVDVKSLTSQRVFLKPKEQVFYYKPVLQQNGSEKILVSKGINPALYTSWINDQLMISNETLESLTVKLGRKYDVVFHFEDNSLRKLRFTGLLENETIEQILEVLKLSSSVNYRINERQIWIIKKNTGQ